jgi:hypothetical protein
MSAGSTTRRTGLTTADGSKCTPTPTNSHANPEDLRYSSASFSPDHHWNGGAAGGVTRATAKIYLSPEDAIKKSSTYFSSAGRGGRNHVIINTGVGREVRSCSLVTTPLLTTKKQVSFIQPSNTSKLETFLKLNFSNSTLMLQLHNI